MTSRRLSLQEALAEIGDFRQAQGRRYELGAVLLLVCVGLMCGCQSQSAVAEWGRAGGRRWLGRLGLRRGPSQATVQRVLAGVDAAQLEAALSRWAAQALGPLPTQSLEGVAVDGKTARTASKMCAAPVRFLSALSHRLGLVLRQVAIATSEQAEFERLLEGLVLEGRVVTADALHTSAENAARVLARGGDYLFVVKGNQKALRDDLALLFRTRPLLVACTRAAQVDAHGSRIEERRLWASTAG